jgi:predicted metal-dependent hydrolase
VEHNAAVRAAFGRWYRARAAEDLAARVPSWSKAVGEQPTRVLVRDQTRRWGSCSADRTLRFNWRLAMAEPALIDYVVVHELVHLRHPNHGPGFWSAVHEVLPETPALRAKLRHIGPSLVL